MSAFPSYHPRCALQLQRMKETISDKSPMFGKFTQTGADSWHVAVLEGLEQVPGTVQVI